MSNRCFGGVRCLPLAFTMASCLAYSSTLKMDATCSSETSVDFKRTTRRYIPEDRRPLHNHRCSNLKSYIYLFMYPSLFICLGTHTYIALYQHIDTCPALPPPIYIYIGVSVCLAMISLPLCTSYLYHKGKGKVVPVLN
jgi:hypothetical protein